MKIAVVTSEVTFVKENYNQFLEHLFKNSPDLHFELIILKNNHYSLVIKGLGLIFLGAFYTGLNLIKNSFFALLKDHEKVAIKYNVNTHYYSSVNSEEFLDFIKKNNIDLIVNARTRDIYKKKMLKAPRLGCINIHHGILPKNRGTMCDLYALYDGQPAGFTIHKMDTKIDNGAIIKSKTVTSPYSDEPLNFPKHIYTSSKVEGKEISLILKAVKETQIFPIEMENISTDITYTKNPNFSQIRRMKQKGMIL
jgi:folate-dependent phosphoribosylglycinamide formyltransferase PurN